MQKPAWSPEEIELIADLGGQYPWPLVVRTYQQEAARRGLPMRSSNAIQHAAHQIGITRTCNGKEWISVRVLIAMTQRERSFVRTLVGLGVQRRGYSWSSVLNRRDIRRLARTNPQVFAGIPRGGLFQLLESEELADQISENYPKVPQQPMRVLVEELGVVFPSLRAAAKRMFVDPSTISRALNQGRQCCGFTVRRVP